MPLIKKEYQLKIFNAVGALEHGNLCDKLTCTPLCDKIKRILSHLAICKNKTGAGGCAHCRRTLALCGYHAKRCEQNRGCSVPHCDLLKHKLSKDLLESEVGNWKRLRSSTMPPRPAPPLAPQVIPNNVAMRLPQLEMQFRLPVADLLNRGNANAPIEIRPEQVRVIPPVEINQMQRANPGNNDARREQVRMILPEPIYQIPRDEVYIDLRRDQVRMIPPAQMNPMPRAHAVNLDLRRDQGRLIPPEHLNQIPRENAVHIDFRRDQVQMIPPAQINPMPRDDAVNLDLRRDQERLIPPEHIHQIPRENVVHIDFRRGQGRMIPPEQINQMLRRNEGIFDKRQGQERVVTFEQRNPIPGARRRRKQRQRNRRQHKDLQDFGPSRI